MAHSAEVECGYCGLEGHYKHCKCGRAIYDIKYSTCDSTDCEFKSVPETKPSVTELDFPDISRHYKYGYDSTD